MSRKNPYVVGRAVIWQLPGQPERRGKVTKVIGTHHVLVEYVDCKGREFEVFTGSPFLRHTSLLDQLADLA